MTDKKPNEDNVEIVKLKEQLAELTKNQKDNKLLIDSLTSQNKQITEINNKLFLQVTGKVTDSDNTENDTEYSEHVGKEFWEKLSDKDRNKLKNILEGEDE